MTVPEIRRETDPAMFPCPPASRCFNPAMFPRPPASRCFNPARELKLELERVQIEHAVQRTRRAAFWSCFHSRVIQCAGTDQILHYNGPAASSPALTPSLPQLEKCQRWKVCTYTPADSIFGGPITNLVSILCILTEIISRAHAKGKKRP